MDPNYNNVNSEFPPLTSSNFGRRSLPPSGSLEFQGPQPEYALPSYPSSTIHYYFPHSHALMDLYLCFLLLLTLLLLPFYLLCRNLMSHRLDIPLLFILNIHLLVVKN